MVNGAAPVGGQSRPGGRAVLVTPRGVEVGTARIPTRRTSGNGRRRVVATPVDKKVRIEGTTVFINGVGQSVPLDKQEEFIRQQTGSLGSSAKKAITSARETARKFLSESQKRISDALRKREDIRPGISRRGGPSLIDIPKKLTRLERLRFSAAGQAIGRVGRRGDVLTAIREPVLPPEEILETRDLSITERKETPFAFGQGTPTTKVTFRDKTLAERIGVEESKDTKKLEQDFLFIQSGLATGRLTEEEANAQIDTKFDKFITKQAIKKIPQNVAIAAGLGALSLVPVVGPIVSAGLVGDLFLRRKRVLSQFKKFPKATSIETASFIVGGLAGSRIGSLGRGALKPPKITEDSLSSVIKITGQQKTRLINEASTLDPRFLLLRKEGRISGVSTYKVTLKDGRTFQIVEFNKLSTRDVAGGLSGEKNFLGFEVGKAPKFSERITGKGVTVTRAGEAETFIQAIRFKPINNKIVEVFNKQLGISKAKTIEVLSKSKAIPTGQGKFQIISETRIASIKNTQRALELKIRQIQRKLDKGGKLSQMELRGLVNLERRSGGLKPFTEAVFRAAGFSTITKIDVLSLLKSAEATFTKNTNILSRVTDIRTGFLGEGFTVPGKIQPGFIKPAKIVKTPLSKTFAAPKKSSLITSGKARLDAIRQRNRARNSRISQQSQKPLSQRFNEAQSQQQLGKAFGQASEFVGTGQFELTAASSSSAIAKALAPTFPNVSVKVLTPIIATVGRFTLAERIMLSNPSVIDSRLSFNQNQLLNLKNELKLKQSLSLRNDFTTKAISRIKQDIKTKQAVQTRLKSLQKLKLKLQQKNINITGLTSVPIIPKIPKVPARPFGEKKPVVKRGPLIPKLKNQGFHAFAKQKGLFKKINKVPVTKKKAKDMASFVVDHSTSARGKIVRVVGKVALKPLRKVPKNYFNRTSKKYRTFKIVAGKRVPLINEFIEKRAKRIDTKGEKKGLSAAKSIAKLKLSKPTKAFKNKSNFKTSKAIKLRRKI